MKKLSVLLLAALMMIAGTVCALAQDDILYFDAGIANLFGQDSATWFESENGRALLTVSLTMDYILGGGDSACVSDGLSSHTSYVGRYEADGLLVVMWEYENQAHIIMYTPGSSAGYVCDAMPADGLAGYVKALEEEGGIVIKANTMTAINYVAGVINDLLYGQ